MDVQAKRRLRYILRGSIIGFFPPFIAILVVAGGSKLLEAAIAGAINSAFSGPLMTFLFGEVVPYTRRFSFVPAILIQAVTFLFSGGMLMYLIVAIMVFLSLHGEPASIPSIHARAIEILRQPTMLKMYAYMVPGFVLLTMFQQVRRKLGPGVIKNWITGKYHKPREEEAVFMFLDLKDSTPLAERLGSLEFSALVQDFFNDLSLAVFATKAQVSHYIGDEAVIVWPPTRAFRDGNCVRLFFKMQEEVTRRSDYYNGRYGVVPSFKAGVHIGPVVAAEVGQEKSEIVYHGDAVNTTARIVGLCAGLQRDLLVSDEIAARIGGADYDLEDMGGQQLKGKAEPVRVYSASRR